jgi:hypothetical protein
MAKGFFLLLIMQQKEVEKINLVFGNAEVLERLTINASHTMIDFTDYHEIQR